MEVDILKLAANAYHKLLNVEYHIVLGRKGKSCLYTQSKFTINLSKEKCFGS